MSVKVYYEILNQKGTPAFFSDTYANRPAFGYQGRVFISTDTGQIFEDTGSAWTLIADAGVGGGTLASVTANGNTTATGIVITAGGLSTDSLTDTALTTGSVLFSGTGGLVSQKNANLFWDNTNNRLGINTTSPGVPLDIHGTGTNAQFNGTGTNNAYLQFQNAGTSKWRIGNTYNAGANNFEIYNNALTASAISITGTNNQANFGGNILLPANNTVGGTNFLIGQSMANSDYWYIFGNSVAADQGELVFQLGDNGVPIANNGQRFRFNYDNVNTGTSKDVLIIDYNASNFNGNLGLSYNTNTWFSGYVAFEMGSGSLVYPNNATNTQLWNNLYVNTAGNTIYKSTGIGGLLSIGGGGNGFVFYTAPSGSAGNTATLTQQMTLSNTGIFTLASLGTGTVTATSGTLSTVSDMRLKIDAGFIENALDKIINLKPRYFYWKEESGLPTNIKQLGFYAQEVNEILGEEAANTPINENTYYGITDRSIIAFLVKSIQELNEKIQKNYIN